MSNFKKIFTIKVVSVIVAVSFLVTNTVYPETIFRKSYIRKPLDSHNSNLTPRYLYSLEKIKARQEKIEQLQTEKGSSRAKRRWKYIKPKQFSIPILNAFLAPPLFWAIFGTIVLVKPDVLTENISQHLPLVVWGSILANTFIFWAIRFFVYYNLSSFQKRVYVRIFKGTRVFNIILSMALVSTIVLNIFSSGLPGFLTINPNFGYCFATFYSTGELIHNFIYKLTSSSVEKGDDLLQNIGRLVLSDPRGADFKKPFLGAIGKELRRIERRNKINLEKQRSI